MIALGALLLGCHAVATVAPPSSPRPVVRVLGRYEADLLTIAWIDRVRARIHVGYSTGPAPGKPPIYGTDVYDLRTRERVEHDEVETDYDLHRVDDGVDLAYFLGPFGDAFVRRARILQPDAKRIVYWGVRDGEVVLESRDWTGADPRLLDEDSFDGHNLALSNDGGWVAWNTHGREVPGGDRVVAVASLADGQEKIFANPHGEIRNGPSWGAGDRRVYASFDDSAERVCLEALDVETLRARSLRCAPGLVFTVDPSGLHAVVATPSEGGYQLEWISLPNGDSLAEIERVPFHDGRSGVTMPSQLVLGDRGTVVLETDKFALLAIDLASGRRALLDDAESYEVGGLPWTEGEPFVVVRTVSGEARATAAHELVTIDIPRLILSGGG